MTIGEYCELMRRVDDDIYDLDHRIEKEKHCGRNPDEQMINLTVCVAEEYLEMLIQMQDLIKSLKVE